MTTYSTDTGRVMALGTSIVTMAGGVDGAASDVAGTPCLAGPPETAAALAAFAQAYGQTTSRLHDDVVALGRLTQAAAAEYDAVEAAATQIGYAEGLTYQTATALQAQVQRARANGDGGGSDG
jgi:hypothetical protein